MSEPILEQMPTPPFQRWWATYSKFIPYWGHAQYYSGAKNAWHARDAEVERLRSALSDAEWALRNNPMGQGKSLALERITEGLL